MVPGLHRPRDFQELANRAIKKCDELQALLEDSIGLSPPQKLEVLDKISNQVCSVIDAAEACRNLHSDDEYRAAAEETFSKLSGYINSLNANWDIYKNLKVIVSNDDIRKSLTVEEELLAIDMFDELEVEGIHIKDPDKKESLAEYQNRIMQLESEYMHNVYDCANSIGHVYNLGPLSPLQYEYVRKWLSAQGIQQDAVNSSKRTVRMCSNPKISSMMLKLIDDEDLRKEIWRRSHRQPEQNITLLGDLITTRHSISRLLNFKSYAHKSLTRHVLKNPRRVQEILQQATQGLAEQAETEADLLRAVKKTVKESCEQSGPKKTKKNRIYASNAKDGRGSEDEPIEELYPWDEGFLTNSYKSLSSSEKASNADDPDAEELGKYLTLDSCMNGLRHVCARVFGINMKRVNLCESEVWTSSQDLMKFCLIDSEGKNLGYIYFDFFSRPNKFTGAAHFTIRCGCSNSIEPSSDLPSKSLEPQLPVIALVFNFPKGASLSIPALEALYHEMGHALHSLLSRTKFQHLSGARGSADFVEVPSHLFEHFARNATVIQSWARKESDVDHYQLCDTSDTLPGAAPPLDLIEKAIATRTLFAATEAQTQLLYALADQYAFGPDIIKDYEDRLKKDPSKQSELIYTLLEEYVDSIKSGLQLSPTLSVEFLRHTHLLHYAGAYYSYLFARMYAAQIWYSQFENNPLSRSSGEKLWTEMLQFGSSRPPAKLLEELAGPLDPSYYLKSL